MIRCSAIIPVYNEEATVLQAVETLLHSTASAWLHEVIIVDDGSTDGTAGAIAAIPDQSRIRVLRHAYNRGKGAALRTGFGVASGDCIIVHDADTEYHPDDIVTMLRLMDADASCDAVYGSRNIHPHHRGYRSYVLGVRMLTAMVNICYRSALTDVYTCYKLIRSPVLRSLALNSDGFEIEMEITAKLLAQRRRIAEVPIRYHPRTFAQGKKIRVLDGIRGARTLLSVWRLGRRSPTHTTADR